MRYIPLIIIALSVYSCRWVDTKEEQISKELKNMKAPEIAKINYIHADDFDSRSDSYHWMVAESQLLLDSNNLETSKIREHILAENKFVDAKLYEYENLQQALEKEILDFMDEDQDVFHYPFGDYVYFLKRKANNDYPILRRYLKEDPSSSKIIVDFQKMSRSHSYFKIGALTISPNNQYIAYSIDTTGNDKYFIRILEIPKNLTQTTNIQNSTGEIVWNNDNKSIFYVESTKNGSRRNSGVYEYRFLDSNNKKNVIINDKKQDLNWSVKKSKSNRFIFIYRIENKTTTTYFIDLQKNKKPVLFNEKEPGHKFFLGHQEDYFIIRTNTESSPNFKVFKTKINNFEDRTKWELLVGHREDAVVEAMEVFRDFIVLEERIDGIKNFHILNAQSGMGHYADFKEETYSAKLKYNFDYLSNGFIYEYSSLSTPTSIFKYSAESRDIELLHEKVPNSDFEESDYKTDRIWATSFDGNRIPISLIYKRNTKLDGTAPLNIEYEGVYGESQDLNFKPETFSLLDRGFVFAIAHIRGGGYLGEKWHSDGTKTAKAKSIYDLIYSIEHLINEEYVSSRKIFTHATEDNAAIVCSAINLKPELFKGLLLRNPKTDLVTSLFQLKSSSPKHVDEWGDPFNEKNYFYLKGISPYENIFRYRYPNILIQNDLHSSSSFYWEGLKWVAKLREYNSSKSKILIHTDLTSQSNQKQRAKNISKTSKEYAFMLSLID